VCRFSKRVLLLPKINFAVGECIFWRQWFSLAVFKEQFPWDQRACPVVSKNHTKEKFVLQNPHYTTDQKRSMYERPFFFKKKCSEKWNPFKCSFERMQVRIFISNALESFFAMKVAFLEEAKKERDSKPPSSFWL
jgi:hypothetical protein